MFGPDSAVADFQGLAEALFRLRIVPHFEFHRAVLYERRDVRMRPVIRLVGRGGGAGDSIRGPAVGPGDWGIAHRVDATIKAYCGVGHALDPPTVIRLNGEHLARGPPSHAGAR